MFSKQTSTCEWKSRGKVARALWARFALCALAFPWQLGSFWIFIEAGDLARARDAEERSAARVEERVAAVDRNDLRNVAAAERAPATLDSVPLGRATFIIIFFFVNVTSLQRVSKGVVICMRKETSRRRAG